jgi:hypothetical protein
MEFYQKISDTANEFFFSLTFEQLEKIFNVQLFGLSEEQTEANLEQIREHWNGLDWSSVMQIINDNEL